MNEQAVFAADLERDLAHRLEERLRFDIADRAADLGDYHVRVRMPAHRIDERLDFVGDVGDDLNGGAQVFAAALLVQHVPVDLAGGQIRKAIQILVDEPLVVAEVEVGLRAVLGHVHLAVLIRAHRTGIDVDVGIELLRGHLQPARLQEPAQRGRRDSLAQSGNYAAGYEHILGHLRFPL